MQNITITSQPTYECKLFRTQNKRGCTVSCSATKLIFEKEFEMEQELCQRGAALSPNWMLPLTAKNYKEQFQIFKLNFSCDMSKMRYFKSIKIFKNPQALPPPPPPYRPTTFNFGDLNLRDLSKLCFFKRILTKSNF